MCKGNTWVAQELGRSCHLHINHRDGEAVNSNLQAGKNRIQLVRANRMLVWYRRAKENEAERNGCQEIIVSRPAAALSEATSVFDSERLKEIIGEFGDQLKPLEQDKRLSDIKQTITLVDGH